MLRHKTEIAWFSHLVRHTARKQSELSLFLQPRNPHGALGRKSNFKLTWATDFPIGDASLLKVKCPVKMSMLNSISVAATFS